MTLFTNLLNLLKTTLKSDLFFPVLLLSVYIIFLIVARGVIPTGEELVDAFATLYSRYGYEIIGLAAFLESLILVNFFVPGQVAMALGIIFARSGETELPLVLISVVIGACSGYFLDYILGYFGFSDIINRLGYGNLMVEARRQLDKFGKRGLIISFVHSNIASFMALIAGIVKIKWWEFLAITVLSTIFWASIWSLIVYSLGDVFLVIIKKYTFLLVLLVLVGLILGRIWKRGDWEKRVRVK